MIDRFMSPFLLYTSDELWTRYYYVQGMESHHDYLYISGNPPEPTGQAVFFALASGGVLLILVALLDSVLKRKMAESALGRRHPLLTPMLTAFALVCLFFITWETAMAYFTAKNPYQVFVPDPITMWSVNPKFRSLQDRTGQHYPATPVTGYYIGFEHEKVKQAGMFRIICLGDSQVVACADLNNDTRYCYPKCLERALQKAFPHLSLDVVNGGVSGYTSFQGLALMRRVMDEQKPDVLILGYGYHDSNYYLSSDHMVLTDRSIVFTARSLLYRSQVFIILRKLIMRSQSERFDKDLNRSLYRRVPPDLYEKNYEEFLAMGRRKGFRVVVLLQPLIGSVRELHERTEPYRKQALEFASRFGIPVVDCYSVFERFKGRANDDLFTDNIHLSSKGHLLVAREIFKVLVENNIPEKLKNDRENK